MKLLRPLPVLVVVLALVFGARSVGAEAVEFNSPGNSCIPSGTGWKTGSSNVADFPDGYTVTSVIVKAGQNCVTVYPTNDAPTCYSVSIVGQQVTVTKIGSSKDCKDISHLEGYATFTEPTPTPTSTPTNTATPTETSTPTVTPTDDPTATPTNTETSTPDPCAEGQCEPSATPTITPTRAEVCDLRVIGVLFELFGPDGEVGTLASYQINPNTGRYAIPNVQAQERCLGFVAVGVGETWEITIDCQGNINIKTYRCMGGGCPKVYNDQ